MFNVSYKIISRAWILMGGITVILIAGILVNWNTSKGLKADAEQLVGKDFRVQLAVDRLRLSIVQVQQWLTDISATRGLDGLDDGYAEAEKYAADARRLINEIEALSPEQPAFYREMRETFDNYYATGHKMAQLYVAEGPSGGNPFMANFDQAAESMSASLESLVQESEHRRQASVERLKDAFEFSTLSNILSSALITLALVTGLLYFIRLLRPLENIREVTVRLADEDLTGEIESVEGRHEIATLSRAFVRMKDNMTGALREINQVADNVTGCTTNLSKVISETNQGVSQQNAEIEQIATAINEMAVTVQNISRNTSEASVAATRANEAVDQGGNVVEQAATATRVLADDVARGADVVERLRADSENIGGVLDVIRGIAEQTNLLALNAAIEAARAGEQGRGFAVVADEVRTLASRTQDSTSEIQKMIEQLQLGAGEAAGVMEHSRGQADQTATLAAEAGKSLDRIRTEVTHIDQMSTQIATAAEQQGVVAGEINRNIERIRTVSKQTASTADTTTAASDNLQTQAGVLHQYVARFKLSDPRGTSST